MPNTAHCAPGGAGFVRFAEANFGAAGRTLAAVNEVYEALDQWHHRLRQLNNPEITNYSWMKSSRHHAGCSGRPPPRGGCLCRVAPPTFNLDPLEGMGRPSPRKRSFVGAAMY